MRVLISVGGKFNSFDLARELYKQSALTRLITSYPAFEVVKSGIPKQYVRSVIIKEIVQRAWSALPAVIRNVYHPQFAIHQLFDFFSAKYVIAADIAVVGASMGLLTMRAARKCGDPIIIVDRGSTHIVYQDQILRDEYRRLGIRPQNDTFAHPLVIKKSLQEYDEADYICVPSRFAKDSYVQNGIPSAKILQIPYGVDVSLFQPQKKNDAVFRVIFGGGISVRKGVHYLVQAWAELRLPNAELLLIGPVSNELRPFLDRYKRSYRQIEYLPFPQLASTYSQGSLFAILSIEEGLALVQAQAMACGLPLLATPNTGSEELITDGVEGFIVKPRDVEAVKERIYYAYTHQDMCAQMGRAARARIESEFTWERYGLKMTNLYRDLLSRRSLQANRV